MFKLCKGKLNQQGMGLLNVLLGMSLLTTLGLFSSQHLVNTNKGVSKTGRVMSFMNSQKILQGRLSYFAEVCHESGHFANKRYEIDGQANGLSLTTVELENETWESDEYKYGNLTFSNLSLLNKSSGKYPAQEEAVNVYSSYLRASFKNEKNELHHLYRGVKVRTNNGGIIISCEDLGSGVGLWQELSNGDIGFFGENVGLGVAEPSAKLHVDGGIRINHAQGDDNIGFGHIGFNENPEPYATEETRDGSRIYTKRDFNGSPLVDYLTFEKTDGDDEDPDGGIQFTTKGKAVFDGSGNNITPSKTRLLIKGNGNIGIGLKDPQVKLDVDGSLRLREETNALAPCTRENLGEIKNRSVSNSGSYLMVCSGQGSQYDPYEWRRIGQKPKCLTLEMNQGQIPYIVKTYDSLNNIWKTSLTHPDASDPNINDLVEYDTYGFSHTSAGYFGMSVKHPYKITGCTDAAPNPTHIRQSGNSCWKQKVIGGNDPTTKTLISVRICKYY